MPTPSPQLTQARAALATARAALVQALDDDAVASAARDDARRRFAEGTPERTAAEAAAAAAAAALTGRQAAERDRRAALAGAISAWLQDMSPAADVARITADTPIVLFPVRIETRFDLTASPPVLKVRIYPDEIWINQHETALTRAEVDAAKRYYLDANANDGSAREPWRQIISKMSPERAAYVLRVMTPVTIILLNKAAEETAGEAGDDGPNFPENIALRSDTWTRPAEAVLPDRWLVFTTRNGVTSQTPIVGRPIPEPLPTTVDPNVPADRMTEFGPDGYQIDDDLRWTVDFDRAEAIGMAVRIPLGAAAAATDGTGGFDRLLVIGVKTSMSALDTSALIEQLFDAHHYTRGLSFVPQGTPTNNTKDRPTPFPRDDPQGEVSFAIERASPPDQSPAQPSPEAPSDPSDGYKLTKLLGLPAGVMTNVAGSGGREEALASSMNRVLWPATLGYFMEHVLDPVFSGADHDAARRYFVGNVRARGPAPALRVGAVPYGVLPIVSTAHWAARGGSPDEQLEAKMIGTLRRLLTIWKAATAGVVQLGRATSDPLGDLVRVLATYPSSREVRVRTATGAMTSYNLSQLLQFDFAILRGALHRMTNGVLTRIGHPEWTPRVREFTFDAGASLFSGPIVAPPAQMSDTAPLLLDYLDTIHGAWPSDLLADNLPVGDARQALLYKVVRHAALVEYARVALATATRLGLPGRFAIKEIEFFFIHINVPQPLTLSELFALPVSGTTLGALLIASGSGAEDFRGALGALRGLPTRELDRLLTETLDLASHRLDAWVTALATRRLREMRTAQEQVSRAPIGSQLGGYAFVENLRPATRRFEERPGAGHVEIAANNGGFIHAPSMAHAATAAVLRSGHLSYRAEDPAKYAIDLSSARTRAARTLLDEVRAGQPLGAVLGFRFERGLHDRASTIPQIDAYRYELRRLYPLVANKSGAPSSDPVDEVAARNVVDGLQLWNAARASQIPFATDPQLPKPGTAAHSAIVAEIAILADHVDAVMDLTTAESVFQLVRGNVASATATLDALASGTPPPDPEVARSVRGGAGVTHRVPLILEGDTAPALPAGWPTAVTPRAAAEPFLDAWAGRLLGDPRLVQATVRFKVAPDGPTSARIVALSELGLRPLDIVALARAATEANQGSLLDRHLGFATTGDDPTKSIVSIDYTRTGNSARTFPEIMEVARAISAVISEARALRVDDFALPAEASDRRANSEPALLAAAAALLARASTASAGLATTASALSAAAATLEADSTLATAADAVRVALRAAAAYLPGSAFPAPGASPSELLTAARAVSTELARRTAADAAVVVPADGGQARIDAATARLQAVFGRQLRVLPPLVAPAAPELQQALDGRAALLGGDDAAPQRFLQQASAARVPLGRWRQLALYAGALGTGRPRVDVMQLPLLPDERWVGLPFLADAEPPTTGRVSLLALTLGASAPTPTNTWRGLLLDEWVELIPSKTESTAVAFHHDSPGAEAGQAVLVAVPARAGASWALEDLVAAVGETFDLAKVRAVEPEQTGLGQLLPGIYFAQNTQQTHTASTNWAGTVFGPVIGAVLGGGA